MPNQLLIQRYKELEVERVKLKEKWINLGKKLNNEEAKNIHRKLSELTMTQAYILIDLEKK